MSPVPRVSGSLESTAADVSAVARSAKADVAQLAERVLGKDEVTSSILVIGSNLRPPSTRGDEGERWATVGKPTRLVHRSAKREGGLAGQLTLAEVVRRSA